MEVPDLSIHEHSFLLGSALVTFSTVTTNAELADSELHCSSGKGSSVEPQAMIFFVHWQGIMFYVCFCLEIPFNMV